MLELLVIVVFEEISVVYCKFYSNNVYRKVGFKKEIIKWEGRVGCLFFFSFFVEFEDFGF